MNFDPRYVAERGVVRPASARLVVELADFVVDTLDGFRSAPTHFSIQLLPANLAFCLTHSRLSKDPGLGLRRHLRSGAKELAWR
jgi:hypothetical protein